MDKEFWKDIVGYEGYYQISNLGRVKRLQKVYIDSPGRRMLCKEKILKVKICKQTGYPYVNLSKNGEVKFKNIHTLVADAFIPNPDNLPCVNHIDENRSNSVLSNLERCTYSYNNSYGSACAKRKATMRKNLEGKHKPIYQFDMNGNLLNTYNCGVKQLEEKFGFDIGTCLTGKCKTSHGFVFSYNNKFSYTEDRPKKHQKFVVRLDEHGNEIKRYKSVSEAAKEIGMDRHVFSRSKSDSGEVMVNGMRFVVETKENEYIPKGHKGPRPDLIGKCSKAISQFTTTGNYVQSFNSVKEAAICLGNSVYASVISNCLNGRLKTAHGFIWKYKGESPNAPVSNEHNRPVNQFTLDGKYITTYASISDANTKLGKDVKGGIRTCLYNGTNKAYGYIWRYAEEVNK